MNELVIWANSYCRSTLAFYRGLGTASSLPVKIVVMKGLSEARKKTGFDNSEFADLDIVPYEGIKKAEQLLFSSKNSLHIFGAYQSRLFIRLIESAIRSNISFGVASEAPCNMVSWPIRPLKNAYQYFVLPAKVKNIVKEASFIINYSGDDINSLIKIGWKAEKVIPCGYYSPRIPNTKNVLRGESNWLDFNILLSGIHQWHRSPMLLLKALYELKKKGLSPTCNITQTGPLLGKMKQYAEKHKLTNVNFLGFVDLEVLNHLYESCSVYVGTGNYEPWGMRLNDVLQCGAPLIVNRGMGGVKLVDDYGCGLTFNRNDYMGLAEVLEKMMKEKDLYLLLAQKAFVAAESIIPERQAAKISYEVQKKIRHLF
jgi:glycosyltransferase involved in cell wall biosynthesis